MNEKTSSAEKRNETKSENSISHIQKSESSQFSGSLVDRILFLQRTIGNQAVNRMIMSGTLQAKLRIGEPGDIYEQEADRVAEEVIKMPEPTTVSFGTTKIQREYPECEKDKLRRQSEEEEEELQAKAISDHVSEVNPNLESHIRSLEGGGQPLSEKDRAFFEPRFGYDFSHVRVHTDAKAAEAAGALNARAFTVGQDLVFGEEQYLPETSEGKRLVAHELTHMLQQTGGILQSKLKDEVSNSFIQTYTHLLMDAPIIQRRQRQIYFALGRPQETESLAPRRLTEYLNRSRTSLRHLEETRGIAEGKNVVITGRASLEAPRNLSDPEKMEFNRRLSERRAQVVGNYLQHTDRPPLIDNWDFAGDRGADNDEIWRRVEVDIEEDEVTREEGHHVTTEEFDLAQRKDAYHRQIDNWRTRYLANLQTNAMNARQANQRFIEFEENAIGQLRTAGAVGAGVAYLFGTPGAIVALCVIVLTEVATQGLSGIDVKIAAAVAGLNRRHQDAIQEISGRHESLGNQIEGISSPNSPEWGSILDTIANLGVPEITPENIIYRDLLLALATGGGYNISGSQWNVNNMSLFGDAPWYHSWDVGSPGWTNGRDIADALNELAEGDPSTRKQVSINPP